VVFVQYADAGDVRSLLYPLRSVSVDHAQLDLIHVESASDESFLVPFECCGSFKRGIRQFVAVSIILLATPLMLKKRYLLCFLVIIFDAIPTFISFAGPYSSRDLPCRFSHIPSFSSYNILLSIAPTP